MFGPMSSMPDMSEMLGMPPELWAMIQQSGAQRQQAQTGADGAFQQMQGAMEQGAPDIDPTSEWMANLAGNISQAVSPEMGGQAAAKAAIQQKRDSMKDKQLRTLQALQMNYERLAKQADAAGDYERSAKMLSLQFKHAEKENDLRMAHDRFMQKDAQGATAAEGDKNRANQSGINTADNKTTLAAATINGQTQRDVAGIRGDATTRAAEIRATALAAGPAAMRLTPAAHQKALEVARASGIGKDRKSVNEELMKASLLQIHPSVGMTKEQWLQLMKNQSIPKGFLFGRKSANLFDPNNAKDVELVDGMAATWFPDE